jgi:hypothetical protein
VFSKILFDATSATPPVKSYKDALTAARSEWITTPPTL